MERLLVTGGAGFIGPHICSHLLAAGAEVRILDNLSTGHRDQVCIGTDFIYGDVRDELDVRKAMPGVDRVIHLAADISVPNSMKNPRYTYSVNVMGTLNVLEEARLHGVKCCVLASSAAVYGQTDGKPVSETDPTAPLSPYGFSKLETERLAGLYSREFGLPVLSLRLFNVFGPGQRHDSTYAAVVPIFLSRMVAGLPPIVYGDGKQRRDFIHVSDVVTAFVTAAHRPDLCDRSINVASGHTHDLLELITGLNNALGINIEPQFQSERPGDIRLSAADVRLAAELLPFQAKVDFAKGLADMAAESARHPVVTS